MSTSLITGYANGPHVTSKQQGACNAASFTAGKYVLNIGECFSYELVSNNLIRVKEGMAINQGRYMCIDRNDYEELTIDNGLQGVKRSDLIVIRYEKNPNTGIETATMMVIKGTSGDSYTDPEHQEGNILEGDLVDDLLLYRVNLDGLNVESVEALFNMKSNLDSIEAKIGSTDISGIGNGTITGGLAELNNSLGKKQNILTFDTKPTIGSTNPITSGGVHSGIFAKKYYSQDNIAVAGGTTVTIDLDTFKAGYSRVCFSDIALTNASSSGVNSSGCNVYYEKLALSTGGKSRLIIRNLTSTAAKVMLTVGVVYTPCKISDL